MKKDKQKDISLGYAGLGLVLGLLLGAGIVYWVFNRQNDSMLQASVQTSRPVVADRVSGKPSPPLSMPAEEASRPATPLNDKPGMQLRQQPAIEDFRVIQDSLLLIRSFSLRQFHQQEQYALLEALLGNNPEDIQPEINVEFWVSPLRYSGYKKTKNRIIIFGLEHPHQARLHVASGSLMMEYMNQNFVLRDHETFQPLIPFNDQELPDNQFEP
ncbi:MAG: hypothetical protein R6U64_08650 [Bacteroidales bacterium]